MSRLSILLSVAAGLFGALGVAGAAAAAHGGDVRLVAIAAAILLVHAPALLALAAAAPRPLLAPAGGLLVVGVVLFAGDLALRHLLGRALVPMAAPAGGVLMILGWLAAAAGAVMAGLPIGRGPGERQR